jgi:NADP-dependent 3-hydroxy acid dehydrogenase YdfG
MPSENFFKTRQDVVEFSEKIIVITGASEGIGRALSLAFAPKKHKLVLAARNENRLEELKKEIESFGGQALVTPTDVTKRARK